MYANLIAFSILGVCFIFGVSVAATYFVDPAYLVFLNGVGAKTLIIIIADLIACLIVVQIGLWFFYPAPLRTILTNMRLARLLAFVGGGSPFGLFGLQQFFLDQTALKISFTEAGVSSTITVGISLLILHFYTKEYNSQYERWVSLVPK